MSDKIRVSFYDEKDNEIGRRTYKHYGTMLHHARRHAQKIGAKYFWHVQYLRRFPAHPEPNEK